MVEMAEHTNRKPQTIQGGGRTKSVVVNVLTALTMLIIAAAVFAPALWGLIHLYRWALA